jgi:hypothetical protein
MELRVGDRLTDETGEWEIVGRPYSTNMGRNGHVRVRRVDQPRRHRDQDVERARADQRKACRGGQVMIRLLRAGQ